MSDTKEMLRRARRQFTPPDGVMDSLIRRRARKERNRRIGAALVGIILALVIFGSLARALRTSERPAGKPTSTDIFARVHGWIAYGLPDSHRIWAVDPASPGVLREKVLLNRDGGEPVAWSSDGSKLLFRRVSAHPNQGPFGRLDDLVVLSADGTETRLTTSTSWMSGVTFAPDGSQVVYATLGGKGRSNIYVVDAGGGEPRILLPGTPRWFPALQRRVPRLFGGLTFSPDGTKIAYIDGMGDHSNSLRVMNADGSDIRVLADNLPGHIYHLVWSPDGERLAFDPQDDGIYVIGADGSGLTRVIPHGINSHWSPDGSRISYEADGGYLAIAAPDGKLLRKFHTGRSGPWNPLVPAEPNGREPTVNTKASGPGAFLSVTIGLVVVAVIVLLIRHRQRRMA